MQVIGMEMYDIELRCLRGDAIEHDHMVDQGIEDRRIETQRPRANRFEPRRRVGIAAGEEGHVMATANQFFREVRNHSLRSAIEAGRTGLMQRSNLRNSHNPRFSSCA